MELLADRRIFGTPWPEVNKGVSYVDLVTARDESKTVLEYYCSRYKKSASREGWIQRISNDQVRVDGLVISSAELILRMGSRLEYQRVPWKEPAAPYLLQILYEDQHVLALNKPSGLQVLAGGLFQQRTVLQQLQWRDEYNTSYGRSDSSNFQAHTWPTSPVHRLGRGTSGVLLCAKSPRAKSLLAADLAASTESTTGRSVGGASPKSDDKQRRFSKTYRALAKGVIAADEITVDHAIGKVPYPGVAGGLYMASPTGKPSLSKVVVLWRDEVNNCTLVQVNILTGRPHQIRIHLAAAGHPLIGDPLYVEGGIVQETDHSDRLQHEGSPEEDGGYQRIEGALPGDCGYLLHAWRLEFYHPISHEMVVVVAPPPPALRMPGEEGDGNFLC
ncbi:hypothetical protein MPTK1_1g26320 [Marchantia polymorpha subsp. ruderalis]|uniref:Pseudouridine synthase RsuA/RluA-like domain-containing protein n=2 Tax=Marchantia polymorpha TaxID=3197 RepID=A0AAF6AUG9_MARPO|nr:hypothetical protein MARPO_0002s0246 [Marchantia polymorpha]BBN00090.1 hypothetical protein Mp_1g26320 [Marchantia polymorpha subsp. ruderalis]|eukprot:PTQ49795.1 hypothetical protein MARPO_0002s0246 [Marchantia polymorpha]